MIKKSLVRMSVEVTIRSAIVKFLKQVTNLHCKQIKFTNCKQIASKLQANCSKLHAICNLIILKMQIAKILKNEYLCAEPHCHFKTYSHADFLIH